MHDITFADAVRPAPTVILGLTLCEYSLGHELLLLTRRNAVLLSSTAEFAKLEFWQQIFAIQDAIWVCSDPFSDRDRFERPGKFMLGFRWNHWKRNRWVKYLRKLLSEDYALAAAELRNYFQAGRTSPPLADKDATAIAAGETITEGGRYLGAPALANLYEFVISKFTFPNTQYKTAWDYPFNLASWLYFARLEADGRVNIENQKEAEIKKEMADYVEEVRAEEKAEAAMKKRSPEAESNIIGIATFIPHELKEQP